MTNESGLPATNESRTSVQSSSVRFSTMAQPCRSGFSPASKSSRYVVFQMGCSMM